MQCTIIRVLNAGAQESFNRFLATPTGEIFLRLSIKQELLARMPERRFLTISLISTKWSNSAVGRRDKLKIWH